MQEEATVYIVDDDPSVRRGLVRLLRSAGMQVRPFSSAREFLAATDREGPGCILLDVRMPEMTGPELQEKLSESEYCLPIIFLSAHGDVPITAKAMKKGAVDFLEKPVDCDDLLAAIRESLSKDAVRREEVGCLTAIRERMRTLTPREHEIMTYVITGMLNKQIAGALAISEETVKIHRGRVMQKLDVVSVAELVRLCEKSGIAPASVDISRG